MASNVPKKEKQSKEKINYSKIAKELKGKVSFNVDLRKTDKNPSIEKGNDSFTFGTKMALLKAFREYREFRNATNFIPVQRQAKESKKAYKERLTQTKKEMGQSGSHFKGVWIDTPDFAKVSKKRIKNEKGKWTTEISATTKGRRLQLDVGFGHLTTKEKFISIDPLEFVLNPIEAMKKIKKKYPTADYVMPVHSGHRGTGASLEKMTFDKFTKKLNKWANEYKHDEKKRDHWLTGFLVVYYEVVPERGAYGKPLVFDKMTGKRKEFKKGR
ncbi:MAG: hypothetical protein ACD_13C00137G0001 [uncultured bacterium]|nr:MAG: hypothetical protein ACD_13C00137G0001 [uncultured bacterium]